VHRRSALTPGYLLPRLSLAIPTVLAPEVNNEMNTADQSKSQLPKCWLILSSSGVSPEAALSGHGV
jgi:hypothetical protein